MDNRYKDTRCGVAAYSGDADEDRALHGSLTHEGCLPNRLRNAPSGRSIRWVRSGGEAVQMPQRGGAIRRKERTRLMQAVC